MKTTGKVISKDVGIAMPNGTRVPMKSIGAGWGGEAPVKPIKKTVVKVAPRQKFRMGAKGVILKKK